LQLDDSKIVAYFVRHGTTDLNQQNAFRGPIDAPLDAAGIRDANKVATLFEPIDISYIFHSDKKRTRKTAEIISERKPDVEVFSNPNLSAWNVGDLGGELKSEENLKIVEYHVHNPDVAIPGGESFNDFKSRIRPLLQDAIEMGLHSGVPPLLVVHSSVIHELGSMIGGHHEYTLVEPGGVAAAYVDNGELDAEPIFRPRIESGSPRHEVVT